MAFWLHRLRADVLGVALDPDTEEGPVARSGLEGQIHHLTADIRDRPNIMALVHEFAPEVVFHLAAQALVRRSYTDPLETFDTNVLGSVNVLEAIRLLDSPCAVVIVTSDKCSENHEKDYAYQETDPMGGHDP